MADNKSVVRFLLGPVPAVILSLLLLLTLFLLTSAAQHAKLSGEFYSVLLGVNILGIVTLGILIAINLLRLYRQLRSKVLGSRLTLRLVGMFVLLVVLPLTVVYHFSVQFLSKGVDTWFDIKIDRAVDDALLLGATSLQVIKQEGVEKLVEGAGRLGGAVSQFEVIPILDEMTEEGGYLELSLYTQDGRFLASSQQGAQYAIPSIPSARILAQIRRGQEYVGLEPTSDGQQLRIAVPVRSPGIGEPDRILQAIKLLPSRYAELADSVESVSAQYKQMIFFRGPLKFSLILTLTLVALVATLLAVWAAIFVSRRITAPLVNLAEGTRAVAAGDYAKKLPVTSTDELGILVMSFNEMTKQINKAQSRARASQREAESQRTYLETVLGHLSSGVMSFDTKHCLRTANAAVEQILDAKLASGSSVQTLLREHHRLEPLFNVIEDCMSQRMKEWQNEVTIHRARGRQVLFVRGTRLSGRGGGYVVIFDDMTDLIRAQRDAAWGEVARRLAHEIKNPLTPIQLSAERIRAKYLRLLDEKERTTLDRATRTIVQQVETMEEMVNAFSSYAQPVRMDVKEVDFNQLVADVAELHRGDDPAIEFQFDFEQRLPLIAADAGRLRQVLNNLLINAKDALVKSKHPKIRLTTHQVQTDHNAYVELVVADNGPGIPEDMIDRLFEPYVTTKDKGTGLGLAIVKRIVEEHGGTIRVESTPQRGTNTTLRLPIVSQHSESLTDMSIKLAKVRAAGDRG